MHEPVLAGDVVALLQPRADGVYVDCTLGFGGHTRAILTAGGGRVIGIDRDERALEHARATLADAGSAIEFVHADFRDLDQILTARGLASIDGIVTDLGVSSMQLDEADRGFSFRRPGPLDMRMDRSRGTPLSARLATVDETTLADVIWRFGEERRSRPIARAIFQARDRGDLTDTGALAAAIRRAARGHGGRIDPATRTFQALRIWVNEELEGLDRFILAAAGRLAPGCRLTIIAFHSLEDRIVKHTMRELGTTNPAFHVVTKRPLVPDAAERASNPRSRSAHLRALERVA